MSTFDDPNRESVGLPPIWTGAGETEPPGEVVPTDGPFNPTDHTVAEVEEYVRANPAECARVLDAERGGKARVTLVDWLESGAG